MDLTLPFRLISWCLLQSCTENNTVQRIFTEESNLDLHLILCVFTKHLFFPLIKSWCWLKEKKIQDFKVVYLWNPSDWDKIFFKQKPLQFGIENPEVIKGGFSIYDNVLPLSIFKLSYMSLVSSSEFFFLLTTLLCQ